MDIDFNAIVKAAGADQPKQTRPWSVDLLHNYIQVWDEYSRLWEFTGDTPYTFVEAKQAISELQGISPHSKYRIVALVEVK